MLMCYDIEIARDGRRQGWNLFTIYCYGVRNGRNCMCRINELAWTSTVGRRELKAELWQESRRHVICPESRKQRINSPSNK
jgi:hypothetical protein